MTTRSSREHLKEWFTHVEVARAASTPTSYAHSAALASLLVYCTCQLRGRYRTPAADHGLSPRSTRLTHPEAAAGLLDQIPRFSLTQDNDDLPLAESAARTSPPLLQPRRSRPANPRLRSPESCSTKVLSPWMGGWYSSSCTAWERNLYGRKQPAGSSFKPPFHVTPGPPRLVEAALLQDLRAARAARLEFKRPHPRSRPQWPRTQQLPFSVDDEAFAAPTATV